MLSLPPYSSWPLHMKLFHVDAVRAWNEAAEVVPNAHLPVGLTVSVELEGVDGKGTPGSSAVTSKPPRGARTTPIDVKDREFVVPEYAMFVSEPTYRRRFHRHSTLQARGAYGQE
jgi:structure-specific endonuclease subunit SLX1